MAWLDDGRHHVADRINISNKKREKFTFFMNSMTVSFGT